MSGGQNSRQITTTGFLHTCDDDDDKDDDDDDDDDKDDDR